MSTIDRKALLKLHAALCDESRGLMDKKNDDYADTDEVFGNLDVVEAVYRGRISTEDGIIVRLCDKISRLATASRRDLKVKEESARDTVLDLINYAVLWWAKRLDRKALGVPVSEPVKLQPFDWSGWAKPIHRIYVGGPYSNFEGHPASLTEKQINTDRAIAVARELVKKGHYVHVPHAATGPFDGQCEYEWFMELDFSIIKRWATAVYRCPGESPGGDREVQLAKALNLPVWTNLEDVPDAGEV